MTNQRAAFSEREVEGGGSGGHGSIRYNEIMTGMRKRSREIRVRRGRGGMEMGEAGRRSIGVGGVENPYRRSLNKS